MIRTMISVLLLLIPNLAFSNNSIIIKNYVKYHSMKEPKYLVRQIRHNDGVILEWDVINTETGNPVPLPTEADIRHSADKYSSYAVKRGLIRSAISSVLPKIHKDKLQAYSTILSVKQDALCDVEKQWMAEYALTLLRVADLGVIYNMKIDDLLAKVLPVVEPFNEDLLILPVCGVK